MVYTNRYRKRKAIGLPLTLPSREEGWRYHLIVLLPLLVIYSVLAFYQLDHQSLWEDEYLSLDRIASPIPIWQDGHGFLYFALLKWWVHLGTSTPILRALSGLFGALAVCFFYGLSVRLFHQRRLTVVATLLFATSPLLIWYSQEIRYITLGIATTLLATLTLQGLVIRSRFWGWGRYGIAVLLAYISFLPNLSYLLVHGLYLMSDPSRRPLLRPWIVCQVIVLALLGGWFVSGTHYITAFQNRHVVAEQTQVFDPAGVPSGSFNKVNPAMLPYTLYALSTGLSLGPSPTELYATPSLTSLLPYAPLLTLLTLLYGGMFIAGLLTIRRQRETGTLLSLWLGIPIAATFGLSILLNSYYNVRYVATALPAYLLILAAGTSRFQRSWLQLTALGAILIVHGAALMNYYDNPKYAREDARAAAHYLATAAQPEDVILAIGTQSALPYYYAGDPPITPLNRVVHPGQPVTRQIPILNTAYHRLWVVEIRPWQIDPSGTLKTALQNQHRLVTEKHFAGIDIYAYQRQN